jgi:predicted DCC family thiol-disulfide oxidoreductase YuxK
VAWQLLDLGAFDLTIDEVTTAAYWIDGDLVTHRGYRAVARALVAIGGPWSVVGRIIDHRPVSWLADGAYRLVAANRHRMPGGTPACRVD